MSKDGSDETCDLVPGVDKSPDRIDALVWTITKLTGGSLQRGMFDLSKLFVQCPEINGCEQ
jgi:hypothetical protein